MAALARPLAQREVFPLILGDHPAKRSCRLLRSVHRQIEHPTLAGNDRKVQHLCISAETAATQDHLLSQRGLAKTLRARNNQALTIGPPDLIIFTP